MVRFFYFGEGTVETTGEACMFPLDSLLGIRETGTINMSDLSGDRQSTLYFKSRNGSATADTVVINHKQNADRNDLHKQFNEEFVHFLQANQRDPFIVMTRGSLADGTANFVTYKINDATVTTQL
jgi:hypothetical protein